MATSASLAALNWIARTYAPALLVTLGMDVEAAVIQGNTAINNDTRMSAVTSRLAQLDAECWAAYTSDWDQYWQEAGDYVFDQVVSQNEAAIATVQADADLNAKRCLKTALRALEMSALRFRAGGGTLP